MKTIPLLALLLAGSLLLPALASSQLYPGGNVPVPPSTPEELAARKRVSDLYWAADKLFDAKHYAESIPAYKLAIDADIEMSTFRNLGGVGHYGLARAYTELGRPTEALAAYRLAFQANEGEGADLGINGPAAVPAYMNYAILLARVGRPEDAKTVYYAGLRSLNLAMTARDEPLPLLVVFDPDPDATVWTYTPQRLEAAALMAKALDWGYSGVEDADAARALAPDWALPVRFRVYYHPDDATRDAQYALALNLAKTPAEREAIQWAKGWNRDNKPTDRPAPAELRRKLLTLRSSWKKMEHRENWDAIATERK